MKRQHQLQCYTFACLKAVYRLSGDVIWAWNWVCDRLTKQGISYLQFQNVYSVEEGARNILNTLKIQRTPARLLQQGN